MLWIRVILTFHILTAPSYPSEAWSLAVQWPHSWAWPPTAGLPCLRILPKTCVGDVDEGWAGAAWHSARRYHAQCWLDLVSPSNLWCGGWGCGWPELSSEAQQSRRPEHHPVLGWERTGAQLGMGEGGLQEQRAVLRKGRDLMDELWREGRRGEERVTEGEVGRERQRKRDRVWDLFLRLQCQRNENSWSKAGNR